MALACPIYSCHSHDSDWPFDPGNYASSLFIYLKAISLRVPRYQWHRLCCELSSCAQALIHSQVGVIWGPCSTQKAVRASDTFILENFIMFWDSGCLTSLSLVFLGAWVFAEFKVGDFFQVWLFSTPLLCVLTSRRSTRWLLLHYVVFMIWINGLNRWSRTSWCWLFVWIWWVAILTQVHFTWYAFSVLRHRRFLLGILRLHGFRLLLLSFLSHFFLFNRCKIVICVFSNFCLMNK